MCAEVGGASQVGTQTDNHTMSALDKDGSLWKTMGTYLECSHDTHIPVKLSGGQKPMVLGLRVYN